MNRPESSTTAEAKSSELTVDTLPASATGVITIDLDAIAANWRLLEKQCLPAECGAAVKADGYGSGATAVARKLASIGCKTFFVATLDEARSLRAALPDITIYVLGSFLPNTGDEFAALNAQPVIGDMLELAEWDAFRKRSGWSGGAAIHVDTGMNRLGLTLPETQALAPRISAGNHGFTLVLTHLYCADQRASPVTARQLANFQEVASIFAGVRASLANSSGIFLGPSYHFDLARPGAALYGINPTPDATNPMQPVVELKTRVLQTRHVERGDTVGYGATWTARRPTRLAIVAAGYADGYSRAASSSDGTRGADVVIAGVRCPIAGRISMDMLAVDITDLPAGTVQRGDFVTMIGDGITLDEVGRHFGTIGYEVLTSLGSRYVRLFKGDTA